MKARIRQAIFQGLSDPIRKIRSLSVSSYLDHSLRSRMNCVLQAHVLSSIANCDWPDEYPDLLNSLITLLSSLSPDSVHGAMQVLTEFIKSDLTEDQILPVLRQLLPVLLNILGAPDVRTTTPVLTNVMLNHIGHSNTLHSLAPEQSPCSANA